MISPRKKKKKKLLYNLYIFPPIGWKPWNDLQKIWIFNYFQLCITTKHYPYPASGHLVKWHPPCRDDDLFIPGATVTQGQCPSFAQRGWRHLSTWKNGVQKWKPTKMRIEPSFVMFEPSKIGMFSRNPLISWQFWMWIEMGDWLKTVLENTFGSWNQRFHKFKHFPIFS